MDILEVLKIFTMMEAMFVVGVSVVLLYLYFKRREAPFNLRLVYFLLTVGFVLVLVCTVITVWRAVYMLSDFWYWILIVGYTVTDLGLLIGLKIGKKRNQITNLKK